MSVSNIEFIKDIAPIIAKPLPIKTHAHLLSVSKHFNDIFTPSFNVRKALTFIIEGNINGCDLIQQHQKPSQEACETIRRNQYIVTDEGLFYFDCKTKLLEALSFLEGKSLELLAEELQITEIRVANRKDQKLITAYTGHVYKDDFINLIESDPAILFKRYDLIEGFLGQKHFNFSPYLLMAFRGEKDMQATIMSLEKVTDALKNNKNLQMLREKQEAEILCGGADFVKIDRHPREIDFEELIQYEVTYTLCNGEQQTLTFPLLENPDGIFCYHKQDNENDELYFFYVHKEKKTIEPLHERFITDQLAFEKFKASIASMEMNSSCRLSEDEQHLIKQAFEITLVHEGLFYEDKGVLYRDIRAPFFNLENAYRKCIRLYRNAELNGDWNSANKSWQEDVSPEQLKITWVWQRLCEENKPFYPLNLKSFDDFRRGRWVYNWDIHKDVVVFDNGVIKVSGLGIYKAGRWGRPFGGTRFGWMGSATSTDLVAIHWLIENAKAKVIEFKPQREVLLDCTIPELEIGGINHS